MARVRIIKGTGIEGTGIEGTGIKVRGEPNSVPSEASPAPGEYGAPRGLRPGQTRVVRMQDRQAALDSEAVLVQAREIAAQLMEEAEQRGQKRGGDVLSVAEQRAASLLRDAQGQAAALVQSARDDLTELALEIARKIIGAELQLAPEQIQGVVSQVLRSAGQSRRFVLRLHPADAARLAPKVETLSASVDGSPVILEPDETIAEGGCMLETDRGQVDGRIEAQLDNLEKALLVDG